MIAYAQELGVERVVTFAAMATQMRPEHRSRVFGAATDTEGVAELRRQGAKVLEDGHIGGLNGVLLGTAAAAGLRGTCFLGEMPQVFAQVPFPKASLAILEAFTNLTGVEVDLTELAEQSKAVEEQLGELLHRVEDQYGQQPGGEDAEEEGSEFGSTDDEDDDDEEVVEGTESVDDDEEIADPGYRYEEPEEAVPEPNVRIEELFERAAGDRSKAFELKRELDRLGLFKQYEDRFLDLFSHPDA